ncbi:atpase aaa-type core protein [Rutstroemia sp. NJR-2017a BBW]|nr:atpase aaa-type core protein [Rutstroemia sp. NJR-2017a BBW]
MDAIQDIAFSHEAINDLVLDPEDNKPLLKALAKRYAQMPHDVDVVATVKNDKKIWAGDFVEGKGEGQIILLHGPPGLNLRDPVLTYLLANLLSQVLVRRALLSVAEFTERPLISLTCSHIGVDPEKVEGKLRLWMVKARRWGAILLIDEADVYLEERTAHDFDRNSLFAIFLNCLEYYQGILFLTTNRVGTFDEAFASRIHISIWYPGFDDSKRIKIWKTMIRRLERERKDIKVPWDLTKYIERDEDLKSVEWNGREIRNAFQTAVALAEYQATEEGSSEVELKCEYLDQVVKMSKRFKEYLSTLPDGNTAKKMWKYGMRNDDFGGEKRVGR